MLKKSVVVKILVMGLPLAIVAVGPGQAEHPAHERPAQKKVDNNNTFAKIYDLVGLLS